MHSNSNKHTRCSDLGSKLHFLAKAARHLGEMAGLGGMQKVNRTESKDAGETGAQDTGALPVQIWDNLSTNRIKIELIIHKVCSDTEKKQRKTNKNPFFKAEY